MKKLLRFLLFWRKKRSYRQVVLDMKPVAFFTFDEGGHEYEVRHEI